MTLWSMDELRVLEKAYVLAYNKCNGTCDKNGERCVFFKNNLMCPTQCDKTLHDLRQAIRATKGFPVVNWPYGKRLWKPVEEEK